MSDVLPACPRCGDLCARGSDRCPACGAGLYVDAPKRRRAQGASEPDLEPIGPLVSAELDRLLDRLLEAEIGHLLRDHYEGKP